MFICCIGFRLSWVCIVLVGYCQILWFCFLVVCLWFMVYFAFWISICFEAVVAECGWLFVYVVVCLAIVDCLFDCL